VGETNEIATLRPMESREGLVPSRLRALPSWLVNQAAVPATSLVSAALASAGSRRYDYKVLAALDEYGPASQATLGRRCGIDRSDMVATLNELTAEGFVERAPDPEDRRRNVVTLTRAGRSHLGELDRLVAEAQDELVAPLSPGERTRLVELLTRIVDHHSS
jgi:MarR family transcriptional regulator, lower aerobic nicotinate degradation pathway regulator